MYIGFLWAGGGGVWKVFKRRGESYNPVRERKAFLALFLVSLHPLESPEDRVILGANRGLEEVQLRWDLKIYRVRIR